MNHLARCPLIQCQRMNGRVILAMNHRAGQASLPSAGRSALSFGYARNWAEAESFTRNLKKTGGNEQTQTTPRRWLPES
jgi:hypothetical protein